MAESIPFITPYAVTRIAIAIALMIGAVVVIVSQLAQQRQLSGEE